MHRILALLLAASVLRALPGVWGSGDLQGSAIISWKKLLRMAIRSGNRTVEEEDLRRQRSWCLLVSPATLASSPPLERAITSIEQQLADHRLQPIRVGTPLTTFAACRYCMVWDSELLPPPAPPAPIAAARAAAASLRGASAAAPPPPPPPSPVTIYRMHDRKHAPALLSAGPRGGAHHRRQQLLSLSAYGPHVQEFWLDPVDAAALVWPDGHAEEGVLELEHSAATPGSAGVRIEGEGRRQRRGRSARQGPGLELGHAAGQGALQSLEKGSAQGLHGSARAMSSVAAYWRPVYEEADQLPWRDVT